MSTVDSWIDREEMAALMKRLGPARKTAPVAAAAGVVDVEPARKAAGGAPPQAVVGGAPPPQGGVAGAAPPQAVALSNGDVSAAAEAPVALPPALPRQPAAGAAGIDRVERVGNKLAQIKAQAAASGLLKKPRRTESEPGVSAPFSIAEAPDGDIALGGTIGERLAAFAAAAKAQFECVRLMVVDSRGYSLLRGDKSEPALIAAALTMSHNWMGCRKHLHLKETGAVSAFLGKGYRLVVIPCETDLGFVTLSLATRRQVSDAETEELRERLVKVVGGIEGRV